MPAKVFLKLALLATSLWLPACAANPGPAPSPTAVPIAAVVSLTIAPTRASQPIVTAQPTRAVAPAAPAVLTALPTALPMLRATASGPSVLAENVPGLDDLALAPDGSIYVSNVSDGTVKSYAPGRASQTIVAGLSEPEGMVVLPDGALIIVEQGKNRLLRYDPTTGTLMLWMVLENKTSHAGVDNIILDAKSMTLIIPDSPNGRVLRASLDGRQVNVIAGGFLRPTGAAVEQDGSILIVDENGNTLKRIRPNGSVELIASLPVPDDVVVDENGVIYVVTLGDSAVYRFRPGAPGEVLMRGLAGPQGLLLDRAGDLVVTDTGHDRLISIAR